MSLNEKDRFDLIKPLPNDWPRDNKGIPFLKKDNFNNVDWNKMEYASTSNIKATVNKAGKVLLNFQYDKSIRMVYNNIFRYALRVNEFFAVCTPDYSAYMNMEPWLVEENVIHSLWVGSWLQYLGIKIIPTITWADKRTFDVCFNHIEHGSIVAISTIGVASNIEGFLVGFNEMKKRIEPELIIVRGKKIKGMIGRFVFIDFDETFEKNKEFEQIMLFPTIRIQEIKKEVIDNGWER